MSTPFPEVPQPGNQFAPPAYDFDAAIMRRRDTDNEIGANANSFSKQVADRRVEIAAQTSREKVAKINSDSAAATAKSKATIQAASQKYNETPTGTGISPDGTLRSKLVSGAAAFKGTNYVWGGAKPGGFDCSGLVQYVYGKLGINYGRVSQQQATKGKVTPLSQLQQGDFVAWGSSPATAHHIAIYAGNGMVWESPHKGAKVRLRKVSAGESQIMGIHLNI